MSCPRFQTAKMSWLAHASSIVVASKLKEQSGNVYENKGPLWKTPGDPWMYVKTKDLSFTSGYLFENKGS
jgi:hypothetical protein